jgi:maleate isomerase
VTEESLLEHLLEGGYGWRARIGFIRPGTVDEPVGCQFYRMAPPGVTIVQASLGAAAPTTDAISGALVRAEEAARELATRSPDCIIFGGSPTVVIGGRESEEELRQRVERASGIQSATAQNAAVEALKLLGVERIAIATPFPDPFPTLLAEYLEQSGFAVRAIESLGVDYRELRKVPLRTAYDLAKKVFSAAGDVDGIYVPGAPFPIVDLIQLLEDELRTTVVSSLQASLWKGLQMSGVGDVPIAGFGRLLSSSVGS